MMPDALVTAPSTWMAPQQGHDSPANCHVVKLLKSSDKFHLHISFLLSMTCHAEAIASTFGLVPKAV